MSVSFARSEPSTALIAFADDVGADGPVRVVGGRTQWGRGRFGEPDAREVSAPVGIVSLEPAELIVRAGAGTTWGELDAALAAEGMHCPLDGPHPDSTIGGLLSVGDSGFRRIRYGHIRDLLLEARFVTARGELVKAGAPVVKNVTGYDLCRLLVGSIGTIGLLGEVVLRCGPRPKVQTWLVSRTADPFVVRELLYQPSFIGWTGTETYVCIEGTSLEVRSAVGAIGGAAADWAETAMPVFPSGFRVSRRPRELRTAPQDFGQRPWLAEIGVGVVHLDSALPIPDLPVAAPDPSVVELNETLTRAYDPTGRLNPGVRP